MERVRYLSDIKGDYAFTAFANLIPIIGQMAKNEKAVELFSGSRKKSRLENAADLMEIVAKNREEFLQIEALKSFCTVADLPEMSMSDILRGATEMLSDSVITTFFVLAHRDMAQKISTSAPEATEAPAV